MRTSLNVSEDILDEFDETWQAEGLDSRSRAIREAMQEYIEGHSQLEEVSGEVVAVLAFDYQHHEVIHDLHAAQHQFQDVIETMSHTHQGEWCLETVFCHGDAARVRELVYRLRDFDGVGRVKTMLLRSTAPADPE
ncbi:CopG family ribbon-helix-helix protein [Halorubrum sp. SD683]|uniref:CopG family ribbon-helix-helix protein n=1 Tax=Halorubrum sp. SD683 TaxID=1855873 RepID=UPI000A2DDFED|nr:ribbon-helix-helix protein, CopG family [Halorubrum sp. SD683]OTF01808.1 CopG family transcriptional regulator [Halorubrum sp. SD683]